MAQSRQWQVTSKGCAVGFAVFRGLRRLKLDQTIHNLLELITSPPCEAEANYSYCWQTWQGFKTLKLMGKGHQRWAGEWKGRAVLLMAWGRVQLAAARASKSDFYCNPSWWGKIKYLITAHIMCSVLRSLIKALTVLSRELKSPQIQNAPKDQDDLQTINLKHWAYRQGKLYSKINWTIKVSCWHGRKGFIIFLFFYCRWHQLWMSFKTSALLNSRSCNYFSILIFVLWEGTARGFQSISHIATHPKPKYLSASRNIMGN